MVSFTDGIKFEIVPCFDNNDGSFTYPDTNDGGSWKTTNPKPEIDAIKTRDEITANYNLKKLCRMTRVWRNNCNVAISGLEIDTLAYNFILTYEYKDKSYTYYDLMVRDFLKYLKNQNPETKYWHAPGSNKFVYRTGNFEYKASVAYNIAVKACEHETHDPVQDYSATVEWQKIFGSSYKNV